MGNGSPADDGRAQGHSPTTRAVIVLKGQVLSFLSLLPKFVFIARFHHSAFLPYEYIVLICLDQLLVEFKLQDAKRSQNIRLAKVHKVHRVL